MSGKVIDATPLYEVLDALKAELSFTEATEELIDNSIDGARRNEVENLKVDIEYSREENSDGHMIITDNAGGIDIDNLEEFLSLADSIKDNGQNNSIGAFGVGFFRSVVKLGDNVKIETRKEGKDSKILNLPENITDIPEDEQNWKFPVQDAEPSDMIDEGKTKIEISDLNIPSDGNFLSNLKSKVSETYSRMLAGEQDIRLNVTINGEMIDPNDGDINWSYSPFGFHPRRYERIEIPVDGASLYVTVTVGLLRSGSSEKSGTDIYCQGRKIVSNSKSREGFFGNKKENFIGEYKDHRRFKMVVEYESPSNENIPWQSNKSEIDVSEEGFYKSKDVIKRIAENYRDVRYGISKELVFPFDDNNQESYNNAEVEDCDSYTYNKIMDKFSQDELNTLEDINDRCKNKLGEFGVIDYNYLNDELGSMIDEVKEVHKKHYRRLILNNLSGDIDQQFVEENNFPPNVDDTLDDKVRKKARQDSQVKKYDEGYISGSEWIRPLYKSVLSDNLPEDTTIEDIMESDEDEEEDEEEKDNSDDHNEKNDKKNNQEEEDEGNETETNPEENGDEDTEDDDQQESGDSTGGDNDKNSAENDEDETTDIKDTESINKDLNIKIPQTHYGDLIEFLNLDRYNTDDEEVEERLSDLIRYLVESNEFQ